MQHRICKQCKTTYKPLATKMNTLCCSWGCYSLFRKGRPRIGYRYSRGYKYLFSPSHPDSNKQGYLAEHRAVGEVKIGRRLFKTEIVHHINGIRDDNRVENIVVCTRQEHNLIDEAIIRGKEKRITVRKIPVAQKDTNGSVIKVWDSRTDASKFFGCSISCISGAVIKKRKTQGFFWVNVK